MSVFSFKSIFMAYLDCRKNKRNKHDAIQFEIQAEEHVEKLVSSLLDKTYHPSSSICFVAEKPKLREIFAANFADRVVHHFLVRYLEQIWEPVFIYDSYASRKQKGIHLAVKRLQCFMRSASHNQTRPTWYMQLDIKNFFPQIDKRILYHMICSRCQDSDIRWLARVIIYHDPTKDYQLRSPKELLLRIPKQKSLFDKEYFKGLPIGNLTSQFFANIYLNELDQYVKHQLKCRYYMRYVDDFILLHTDKQQLLKCYSNIQSHLKTNLRLVLNERSTKIQPISNGINFLGYIVKPEYMLCRNRVINNLKEKLSIFEKLLVSKENEILRINNDDSAVSSLFSTMNSYLGHFKHANSNRLIDKLFNRYSWLTYYFILNKQKKLERVDKCPKNFVNLYSQYQFFIKKFHFALIFFQVGCFYEFYDQQATSAVKLLGLKYIKKKYGFYKRAGIGKKALKKYTDKALQLKQTVVIIEQSGDELINVKKRNVSNIFIPMK